MVKIFVIIDGLGDKPCKLLDHKTPLEAAHTPHLNALTHRGRCGYVYPVSETIAPESDIAVTALLGYDPYMLYTGRGPLETYGAGIPFKKGWLALRTNFSTITENYTLVSRRVGRTLTTKEARTLAKAINTKVNLDYPFTFYPTTGHRGVLVIKGNFSDKISNVDPAYAKEGTFGVAKHTRETKIHWCEPLDTSARARMTAQVVNDFVHQSFTVLREHSINKKRQRKGLFPANVIIPRDAGTRLPHFPKKKGWAAVVSMPLELGLAKLAGMHIIPFAYPPLRTKNVYANLYAGLTKTINASIHALNTTNYSHYYFHFKEIDVAGHDNKPFEKKKMLELLDRTFFAHVRKDYDAEIIITGDHSTPCEAKTHTADPVPLLHVSMKKPDELARFTEKLSRKGSLGKMLGKNVLKKLHF